MGGHRLTDPAPPVASRLEVAMQSDCRPRIPNPEKVRRDSVKALLAAWPHRYTLRGRIVVDANVRMLRRLAAESEV